MKLLLALATVLLLLGCGRAHAAVNCNVSISDVSFGAPNLLTGAAVDTTSNVSITCTGLGGGQNYNICLNLETGSGGRQGSTRLMTGPTSGTLSYNLYSDPGRTTRWGAVTNSNLGGLPLIPIAGGGSTQTASAIIYARLTAGQATAPPGAYSSSFAGHTALFLLANGATSCSGATQAATFNTPSFVVTADPPANCNLSLSNLSFGSQGVIAAAVQASAGLTVTCTSTTPYSLSLNAGQSSASPTARKMIKGAESITYGIYKDNARTVVWHDSNTVGGPATGTGTGSAQTLTAYGLVPVQATPSPGAYSDTVVATLAY